MITLQIAPENVADLVRFINYGMGAVSAAEHERGEAARLHAFAESLMRQLRPETRPSVVMANVVNTAVRVLNIARDYDIEAMHALVANRVPCHKGMVNSAEVFTKPDRVIPGAHTIDMLDVVNSVLRAYNIPPVQPHFTATSGNLKSTDPVFIGFEPALPESL